MNRSMGFYKLGIKNDKNLRDNCKFELKQLEFNRIIITSKSYLEFVSLYYHSRVQVMKIKTSTSKFEILDFDKLN